MNIDLEKNNFLYIQNFISPERAVELSREFKNFAIQTQRQKDIQAEFSKSAYDYIGFLELLCEKTPEVSKFIGETVLPTYTYARVYEEGSILEKHKDRPACEISITLHLSGDEGWPIYIKKPNGEEVSLNLKSGDAMLYLGCDAEHWRNQFQGKEYIQVFLHYVKSRGKNSYAYFDKSKDPINTSLNDYTGIYTPAVTPQAKIPLDYKKNIADYIVVLDNIIPDELCDRILQEYENCQDWVCASVGKVGLNDRNVRNVDTIGISMNQIIQRNYHVRKKIDEDLFIVANTAIGKYNEKFPLAQIEQDSGYELLRYDVGQFYVRHCDSFIRSPRTVSCSLSLNDEYDGGEFAFFDREIIVRPKKGSVLLFPSNFMYPHEIMPVTKGTRYSIVTWFI